MKDGAYDGARDPGEEPGEEIQIDAKILACERKDKNDRKDDEKAVRLKPRKAFRNRSGKKPDRDAASIERRDRQHIEHRQDHSLSEDAAPALIGPSTAPQIGQVR